MSTPAPPTQPGRATAPAVLRDRHGRVARDLRVSLTDRCNLRCTYCMPAEGLDWMPDEQVLSDDELVRLVALAVQHLGITTVRLTGGEPLLRKNLEHLVQAIASLPEAPVVALTTNGSGLERRAAGLAAAGLARINVSLDTLDAETFHRLTRRRQHAAVLRGIAAAREAGLEPVKVNTVLMRGTNEHEAPDLLAWAISQGVQLRFIEQMPLDAQHGWTRQQMVTAEQTRCLLEQRFTLLPEPDERRGSAPAELFRVAGTDARVGIIASVTRPFCGACDRVRLTADGQLRNCLFSLAETDLRTPLRRGAGDEEILALWRGNVAAKLPGHGINDPGFLQPARPMSAIGG